MNTKLHRFARTIYPNKEYRRGSHSHGPIVLMYHGTPSNSPRSKYSISADNFKQHIAFLKKDGWHTALVKDSTNHASLPPKTVFLTFDDGYASNYEGAFLPLLENGMLATWFITSNCLDTCASWIQHHSLETKIMSKEQIRELDLHGMEVGSHSCTHRDLSTLTFSEQLSEAAKSKQLLETILDRKVVSFAYPFGKYNNDTLRALQHAGYQFACTVNSGWMKNENNPLLIRRVTIYSNDDVTILKRKLEFADNDVSWKTMMRYYSTRIKIALRAT